MEHQSRKHFIRDDRLEIEAHLKAGLTPCQIAKLMNCHHTTIYREIARGQYDYEKDGFLYRRYSADVAQQKHEYAQTAKGRPLKIGNDHAMANYLETKILKDGYSPAAALGDIQRRGLQFSTTICVATLYSYIEKRVFHKLTPKNLMYRGERKKHKQKPAPRIKRPLCLSIDDRPEHIASREVFRHWEMDCIVSGKGDRAALLTLVERMSRRIIIIKLPDKTTASVVAALDRLERKTPGFHRVFETITCDNGSEFMDTSGMERSVRGGRRRRTTIYYAHPYSSWERGSNENANRFVRRFVPKGAKIGLLTAKRIKEIETYINAYPRRILGYWAADDIYGKCVA